MSTWSIKSRDYVSGDRKVTVNFHCPKCNRFAQVSVNSTMPFEPNAFWCRSCHEMVSIPTEITDLVTKYLK